MAADPKTDLDLLQVIEALEALVSDPTLSTSLSDEERVRLMTAAGRLSRPSKLERLKVSRTVRKERRRLVVKADRDAIETTGIRGARKAEVFAAPESLLPAPGAPAGEIHDARNCYVCKAPYTKLHHFYDGL
jgi:hypothetical protein